MAAGVVPAGDTVFVADIDRHDGVGWTSVHRSPETAERKLLDVAAWWGMPGVLDADGRADFDDVPQISSWGVSCLVVEP